MAHPFLDEITNIVDMGISSVSTHKVEMSQLQSLASNLRAQEQSFYSLINFNGQKVHSCADLNRIIQDIDHTFRTGTLLPRSEVEGMLSQKYKLSDNTKNTLSENQKQVIVATLNQLIENGKKFVDMQMTNSRSKATQLSYVKDRLFAAIQMGISHTAIISPKKAILDPVTISPFLLEQTELDYARLDIKSNTIRGSQAASDFEYKTQDGMITEITIKSTGTGKFIPLDKMGQELADYLLSIAAQVLGKDRYEVIMQGDSLLVADNGPVPIGSANLDQLKKDTVDIIKELVPEYSHVVERFAAQIAIGRSLSNIRGFLGEMRASLLMYALFGDSMAAQLQSTGLLDKIRMTPNGQLQEAPIDFVVKALNEMYGIQVKNTADTSYTWEGEMSASSFYAQRLQVGMTGGEAKFYAAFSYNQPLDAKEVHGDWADWELYRRVTYPSFSNAFNSTFAAVFKSLAPNIIRLSTQTGGDNVGIFSGQTSLTNNFFIMQDKIIAASDVVQALINEQNIRANFGMTAGTNDLWSYGKSPIGGSPDATKIDYSVTLNYKTLFKSAYNMS